MSNELIIINLSVQILSESENNKHIYYNSRFFYRNSFYCLNFSISENDVDYSKLYEILLKYDINEIHQLMLKFEDKFEKIELSFSDIKSLLLDLKKKSLVKSNIDVAAISFLESYIRNNKLNNLGI